MNKNIRKIIDSLSKEEMLKFLDLDFKTKFEMINEIDEKEFKKLLNEEKPFPADAPLRSRPDPYNIPAAQVKPMDYKPKEEEPLEMSCPEGKMPDETGNYCIDMDPDHWGYSDNNYDSYGPGSEDSVYDSSHPDHPDYKGGVVPDASAGPEPEDETDTDTEAEYWETEPHLEPQYAPIPDQMLPGVGVPKQEPIVFEPGITDKTFIDNPDSFQSAVARNYHNTSNMYDKMRREAGIKYRSRPELLKTELDRINNNHSQAYYKAVTHENLTAYARKLYKEYSYPDGRSRAGDLDIAYRILYNLGELTLDDVSAITRGGGDIEAAQLAIKEEPEKIKSALWSLNTTPVEARGPEWPRDTDGKPRNLTIEDYNSGVVEMLSTGTNHTMTQRRSDVWRQAERLLADEGTIGGSPNIDVPEEVKTVVQTMGRQGEYLYEGAVQGLLSSERMAHSMAYQAMLKTKNKQLAQYATSWSDEWLQKFENKYGDYYSIQKYGANARGEGQTGGENEPTLQTLITYRQLSRVSTALAGFDIDRLATYKVINPDDMKIAKDKVFLYQLFQKWTLGLLGEKGSGFAKGELENDYIYPHLQRNYTPEELRITLNNTMNLAEQYIRIKGEGYGGTLPEDTSKLEIVRQRLERNKNLITQRDQLAQKARYKINDDIYQSISQAAQIYKYKAGDFEFTTPLKTSYRGELEYPKIVAPNPEGDPIDLFGQGTHSYLYGTIKVPALPKGPLDVNTKAEYVEHLLATGWHEKNGRYQKLVKLDDNQIAKVAEMKGQSAVDTLKARNNMVLLAYEDDRFITSGKQTGFTLPGTTKLTRGLYDYIQFKFGRELKESELNRLGFHPVLGYFIAPEYKTIDASVYNYLIGDSLQKPINPKEFAEQLGTNDPRIPNSPFYVQKVGNVQVLGYGGKYYPTAIVHYDMTVRKINDLLYWSHKLKADSTVKNIPTLPQEELAKYLSHFVTSDGKYTRYYGQQVPKSLFQIDDVNYANREWYKNIRLAAPLKTFRQEILANRGKLSPGFVQNFNSVSVARNLTHGFLQNPVISGTHREPVAPDWDTVMTQIKKDEKWLKLNPFERFYGPEGDRRVGLQKMIMQQIIRGAKITSIVEAMTGVRSLKADDFEKLVGGIPVVSETIEIPFSVPEIWQTGPRLFDTMKRMRDPQLARDATSLSTEETIEDINTGLQITDAVFTIGSLGGMLLLKPGMFKAANLGMKGRIFTLEKAADIPEAARFLHKWKIDTVETLSKKRFAHSERLVGKLKNSNDFKNFRGSLTRTPLNDEVTKILDGITDVESAGAAVEKLTQAAAKLRMDGLTVRAAEVEKFADVLKSKANIMKRRFDRGTFGIRRTQKQLASVDSQISFLNNVKDLHLFNAHQDLGWIARNITRGKMTPGDVNRMTTIYNANVNGRLKIVEKLENFKDAKGVPLVYKADGRYVINKEVKDTIGRLNNDPAGLKKYLTNIGLKAEDFKQLNINFADKTGDLGNSTIRALDDLVGGKVALLDPVTGKAIAGEFAPAGFYNIDNMKAWRGTFSKHFDETGRLKSFDEMLDGLNEAQKASLLDYKSPAYQFDETFKQIDNFRDLNGTQLKEYIGKLEETIKLEYSSARRVASNRGVRYSIDFPGEFGKGAKVLDTMDDAALVNYVDRLHKFRMEANIKSVTNPSISVPTFKMSPDGRYLDKYGNPMAPGHLDSARVPLSEAERLQAAIGMQRADLFRNQGFVGFTRNQSLARNKFMGATQDIMSYLYNLPGINQASNLVGLLFKTDLRPGAMKSFGTGGGPFLKVFTNPIRQAPRWITYGGAYVGFEAFTGRAVHDEIFRAFGGTGEGGESIFGFKGMSVDSYNKEKGIWEKTHLGEVENWVKFKHFVEGNWNPFVPEELEEYYSDKTNKNGYILDQSGKSTGIKVNKNIFGSRYDINRLNLVKHPDKGNTLIAPKDWKPEDWQNPEKVKNLIGIVIVPVVNEKLKKELIDYGMPERMANEKATEFQGYVSTYHQFENDIIDARNLRSMIIMQALGGYEFLGKYISTDEGGAEAQANREKAYRKKTFELLMKEIKASPMYSHLKGPLTEIQKVFEDNTLTKAEKRAAIDNVINKFKASDISMIIKLGIKDTKIDQVLNSAKRANKEAQEYASDLKANYDEANDGDYPMEFKMFSQANKHLHRLYGNLKGDQVQGARAFVNKFLSKISALNEGKGLTPNDWALLHTLGFLEVRDFGNRISVQENNAETDGKRITTYRLATAKKQVEINKIKIVKLKQKMAKMNSLLARARKRKGDPLINDYEKRIKAQTEQIKKIQGINQKLNMYVRADGKLAYPGLKGAYSYSDIVIGKGEDARLISRKNLPDGSLIAKDEYGNKIIRVIATDKDGLPIYMKDNNGNWTPKLINIDLALSTKFTIPGTEENSPRIEVSPEQVKKWHDKNNTVLNKINKRLYNNIRMKQELESENKKIPKKLQKAINEGVKKKNEILKKAPRAKVQSYNINFDRLWAYALAQVVGQNKMARAESRGRFVPNYLKKVKDSPIASFAFSIKNRDKNILSFLPDNLLIRDDENNIVGTKIPTVTDAMLYQQAGAAFKDPSPGGINKPAGFNPLIHFIPQSMHLFNDDKNLFFNYGAELFGPSDEKLVKILQKKQVTPRQIQNVDLVIAKDLLQERQSLRKELEDNNFFKNYQRLRNAIIIFENANFNANPENGLFKDADVFKKEKLGPYPVDRRTDSNPGDYLGEIVRRRQWKMLRTLKGYKRTRYKRLLTNLREFWMGKGDYSPHRIYLRLKNIQINIDNNAEKLNSGG